VAFDLKVFFAVVAKDPVAVAAVDVFEFLAHQREDRTVVRLADREPGLSARTIAPVVVGVGLVWVPDRAGGYSGAGQPGAAWLAGAAPGWGREVAGGTAGAGAAHAAPLRGTGVGV
jgi:hypothetical protein